jgi:hypothetical protein
MSKEKNPDPEFAPLLPSGAGGRLLLHIVILPSFLAGMVPLGILPFADGRGCYDFGALLRDGFSMPRCDAGMTPKLGIP